MKRRVLALLMAGILSATPSMFSCVDVFAEESYRDAAEAYDSISSNGIGTLVEYTIDDIDTNADIPASDDNYRSDSKEDEDSAGIIEGYSDSYKSSIYYSRLMGTSLGENQADNIINIAKSQVGYKRSGYGNYSGDGVGGGRNANYSEYARVGGVDGFDWCAAFVTWCARKAGISNQIISDNNRAVGFSKSGGWYYDVCSTTVFPRKGDLILFEPRVENADGTYGDNYIDPRPAWNNYMPLLSSHVGIVANDITGSGQTLYYYEGNPEVKYSSLTYVSKQGNSAWVQGFVRPRYTSGVGTPSVDPGPQVPEYTPNISISLSDVTGISATNATLRGTLSKSTGDWISSCGVLLGTDRNNLKELNKEELGKGTNNHNGGKGFDIWYDLNGELGKTLNPGTDYYYKIYAVCGGNTYYSPLGSFKTKQTAYSFGAEATYFNESGVGQRVYLYDNVNGNSTGYIDLSASSYIPCNNYYEAPDGRMWLSFVSSTTGQTVYFPVEAGGTIYNTPNFKVRYGCREIVLHSPSVIDVAGTDSIKYSYELVPGISNSNCELVRESGDKLEVGLYEGSRFYIDGGTISGTAKYHIASLINEKRDKNSPSFTVRTYDVDSPEFQVDHGSYCDTRFPCEQYSTDDTGITCTGSVYDTGARNKEVEMGCAVWVIGADGTLAENGRPYITWNDPGIKITGRSDNDYRLTYNYRFNFSEFDNIAGEYHVIMAARDASGNMSSVEYTTYHSPAAAKTKVNVTRLEAEDDCIVLEWDRIPGINSYNIYRVEGGSSPSIGPATPVGEDRTGGGWELIGSTSETRFEDSSVKRNVNYRYDVSPVLIYNAESYEGESSDSVILKKAVMIDTRDYGESINDDDDTFENRIDLSTADTGIEGIKDVVYSGKRVRPAIVVKYRADASGKYTKLIEGRDYSVVIVDNINVGTAVVKINGIGEFTGSLEKGFLIKPKSLKKFSVVKGSVTEGTEAADAIRIYDGSKLLTKDKDYSVEEIGSSQNSVSLSVKGEGNYTGSKLVSVPLVSAADEFKLASFAISQEEFDYSGKSIKPGVTQVVCADGSVVPSGKYRISYANNKNAGIGVVTVSGKGGYKGTLTRSFVIKGDAGPLSINSISPKIYSGKLCKPAVKVYTATGKRLKKGRDYSVVYKNNLRAGTATVTVKGIGNYAGAEPVDRDFEIKKQAISKVKISGSRIGGVKVTYAGRVLREGVDYTISFGDIVGGNKIKAVITGLANFEGETTKKVKIQ